VYAGRRARRRRRLSALAAVLLVAALVIALIVIVLAPSGGTSGRVVESIFQDDQSVLHSSPGAVARTLDRLRALGVDRLRLTVQWLALAPAPRSRSRPGGFDATDPAAYPAAAWAPYDRVVRLAPRADWGSR
jgi:hypothetical protein